MVRIRKIKCAWCGEETGKITEGKTDYTKHNCKNIHLLYSYLKDIRK